MVVSLYPDAAVPGAFRLRPGSPERAFHALGSIRSVSAFGAVCSERAVSAIRTD